MTPKYNPKHQKRRNTTPPRKQEKKFLQTKKFITLIIILVVVGMSVVGIFIGKFSYDEWTKNHIQIGDEVTMELRIWIANDDGDNVSDIVWNMTDPPLTKIIRKSANETGIPYGLWDQILGMKLDEIKEKLWLPRCVDDLVPIPDVQFHPDAVAGDGWDDRYKPGSWRARCYSFGYDTSSDLGVDLRFTPIIYWIWIIDIQKSD